MKAIVTLETRSKQPRPKVGPFLWSNDHGRHVWKGEIAMTVHQLAEQVNEATDFMAEEDNPYIKLRVVVLEEAKKLVPKVKPFAKPTPEMAAA